MKSLMLSIVVLGNTLLSVFPQEGPPNLPEKPLLLVDELNLWVIRFVIGVLGLVVTWFLLPAGIKAVRRLKHAYDEDAPYGILLKIFGKFFLILVLQIGVVVVVAILLRNPEILENLWNKLTNGAFDLLE